MNDQPFIAATDEEIAAWRGGNHFPRDVWTFGGGTYQIVKLLLRVEEQAAEIARLRGDDVFGDWQEWTPTPENVNALPAPVKRYVIAMEADLAHIRHEAGPDSCADYAFRNRELTAEVESLKAQLATVERQKAEA